MHISSINNHRAPPQGFPINAWDCSDLHFLDRADYIGATLQLDVSHCHFEGQVNVEATVQESIDLRGCTFEGNIVLGGRMVCPVQFSSIAERTSVRGILYVSGAISDGPVRFAGAVFEGLFNWKRLQGAKSLEANNCVFKKRADFSGAQFGEAMFENAHFENVVTFERQTFGGWTSFAGARFGKAPCIHDAKLYPETTFAGAKFEQADNAAAAAACRSLKYHMAGQRNRSKEGVFYALEQRSKCKSGAGQWRYKWGFANGGG